MNKSKDTIYIDIDDDITTVISKLKKSTGEQILLVPPKRPGFLQSAVSVKLLKRTTDKLNKTLVLVTNDATLVNLAGGIGILVAKNLQDEPHLASTNNELADNDDEIIDGNNMPVGILADNPEQNPIPLTRKESTDNDEDRDVENALRHIDDPIDTPSKPAKNKKVPDFNDFRKKILIFGLPGFAVLIFFIWAIFFSASATIVVTASAEKTTYNQTVSLGTENDLDRKVLKSEVKTIEKENSVDFTATSSSKAGGKKATGTVTINAVSDGPTCRNGIANGTAVGNNYVTTSAVSFDSTCKASVGISSKENGTAYNNPINGAKVGETASTATGTATGGEDDKPVVKVSDVDIRTATEKIKNDDDETIKTELIKGLGDDYTVIQSSYVSETGDSKSTPAIGEIAPDGKAKLTVKTKYSIVAVKKTDLNEYLQKYFEGLAQKQEKQRVYETGADRVDFSGFGKADGDKNATVNLSASGKIGPDITSDEVATLALGKKAEEVKGNLTKINGVRNVDVKFSFFWVTSVPNDANKVKVEFKAE